jgi:hypothetical protein
LRRFREAARLVAELASENEQSLQTKPSACFPSFEMATNWSLVGSAQQYQGSLR